MNGSGCKTCPVKPCRTMNYRGSTCAAQRAKFGLGDPQTNADCIRAMSDECLTEKLYDAWRREADKGNDISINWCRPGLCASEECDPDKHKACILRWLQQPAEEDTL